MFPKFKCYIENEDAAFFLTKVTPKICSVYSGEVKFKAETNHSLLLSKGAGHWEYSTRAFSFFSDVHSEIRRSMVLSGST